MTQEQNLATIERFYAAFDAKDGETVAACYAPDSRFEDPAFGELTGEEAGAMWRMLTGRAEDLKVALVCDPISRIGVDTLGYLSLDGMLASVPTGPEGFCHACFSGDYPTPPPTDPDKLRFGCGC